MRRWSPGPVIGGKIKMVLDPTGDFVLFDELPREQRRYEIARDCMASAYADSELFTEMAARVAHAVKAADALLAELERTDGE